MRIYIWSFATLVFLYGCIGNNQDDSLVNIDIPIDTIFWSDYSYEEIETFPPKNIVKNKRYIKLDPSEKYLFGGADKVLFKDNIYILDKRQKKIVVFDHKGNGINILDKVGQGPEEYIQITDFSVDVNGNIYIIDGVSDKLIIYNSAEFISSEKLPFEVDIIQCLDHGEILMGLSTWNTHPETQGKRLLIADRNLTIKNTFLDFDQYYDDSYWISYYSFISNGSNICYNKPIEDFVYSLSYNGELDKCYYFDFGSKHIPFEWRKDVEHYMDKIEEKYQSLKNHTIITDKYIIGTLWDRTETKPFLMDRVQKKAYIGEAVAESDVSDFLDFANNSIVSLLSTAKDDMLDVPEDIQAHVLQENFALMIAELL